MSLNIIYEDKDIIVIDKPAGIAAHPSADQKVKSTTTQTIVELVSKHYPPIKGVGEDPSRPGIVHRLDKETSGLMVVAKNNETFYELKKQFKERKVEKKYVALVSGVLEQETGTIDTPLVKMGTRTRIANDVGGQTPHEVGSDPTRSAITEYKVLKRYEDYTLVEVAPKTGRMHQIRVHFASINHPIACDKLYGRKAKKCPSGLKRHFLHASYLKFRIKNALMEFDAPLPSDLRSTLEDLLAE